MVGIHQVFLLVQNFFAALPPEVVFVATFAFTGSILAGVFGRIR